MASPTFASRNKGHIKSKLICKDETRTEQAHKDACDINKIIKRYDINGLIQKVDIMDGIENDVSGYDFHAAMEIVAKAQEGFAGMPSSIRNRFQNDPGKLLDFVQDENNYDEALRMGIVAERPSAPPTPPPADPPADPPPPE